MDVDAVIGDVVTLLEELPLDDVTEGTLADLGARYTYMLHVIATAGRMRDAIELALVDAMPEDTMAMNGVVVKRVNQNRWKWREKDSGKEMREDIANAIADEMSTDPETGEINPGRRRLIQQAIGRVWRTIPAVQTMKVAGAKDLGLSIFDYKEMSVGYKIEVAVPEIAEEPA
jgi:hypothetical protein